MQPKPPRPTGVTILGVLAILGGIFLLIGGFALIGLGVLIGTLAIAADITNAINAAGYPGLAALGVGTIAAVVIAIGVAILILGLLYLAVGAGFLGGKGWAWTLGMIVSVISIVLAIVQVAFGNYSSIVSVLISLLILYYLTRPRVKSFFGKGAQMGPSGMGSGMSSSMGSGSMGTSTGMVNCRSCGASIPAGATKCPSCGAPVV